MTSLDNADIYDIIQEQATQGRNKMLYHKDTGIPKRIRGSVPKGIKEIVYSRHAEGEFYDKNGHISPPNRLNFAECEVIEVTIFGTTIDKLVLRKPYNETHDLVVVVIPALGAADKKKWFAKTVWLNHKTDTHKPLDKSRVPA